MKDSFKKFLIEHSQDGVWTGGIVDGVAVITFNGEIKPVEPFLKQLGIKLTKTNKYTERVEDAGMGESKSTGDTGDAGDGTSQSQE